MGPTKGSRPDLANGLYGLLTFAIEFLFQAVTVVSDSFVIPWAVAHQAPLSMDFLGKNTGVGCHFLFQGIFLTQGSNLGLLHCRQSPALQADSLPAEPSGLPLTTQLVRI